MSPATDLAAVPVRGPATLPSPRLAARDLRVRFGDRVELDGLSFELGRGEILGLLGPNGAGKSTAFQVLCGLLARDSGEIFADGEPVDPADAGFRRRLGVVFQEASLDLQLTARENLSLAAALYGLARSDRRRRVDEMLRFAELTERADERVRSFSGGMRRRVEIARALLHQPSLLLMDEPTRGLDQSALDRLWEHLTAARRREGISCLISTHRPDEAEHCDRVAILDAGRVIACDTPERLRGQVGGDLVTIEADRPEELARDASERFAVRALLVDGKVAIERPRGHELIPRIVEAYPAGRLRSVSLRRPSLADVFVKLTGRAFRVEPSRRPPEGGRG